MITALFTNYVVQKNCMRSLAWLIEPGSKPPRSSDKSSKRGLAAHAP